MPTASKIATDKLEEIKFRGEKLRKVDVLQVLHAVPDSAFLSTSEAAIFLDMSISQMERMRVSGNGPRYLQTPPMEGKTGTNMAVRYRKVDLLQWIEKHIETSSIKHAKLHGRTFATLNDIVEEVAFYVHADGAVESMVEENTVGTVVDRLGEWDIVWMNAAEACARAWSDAAAQTNLAGVVNELLVKAQSSLASGIEATEIRDASAEATPKTSRGDPKSGWI
jgi:hypothetical protein